MIPFSVWLWNYLGIGFQLIDMASKRQRGECSRTARAYNHDKFTSLVASDYYHNVLAGKTFVLERGLLSDKEDGELTMMITKMECFDFTEQPPPAVINMDKEFYAKAKDMQNNMVQVCGRLVPLTSNAINAYYHTPNIQGEGSDHFDLDNVLRRLGKSGTQWALKPDSTDKVSFLHSVESLCKSLV